MRVQALRHKREATEGAASEDAWALHIAERSMMQVVDPNAKPPQAPDMDHRITENVSETEANAQHVAFETWLNTQPWKPAAKGSGKTDLRQVVRATMENSHLAGQELPANGHETPGRPN
jgi:hypothetical protein